MNTLKTMLMALALIAAPAAIHAQAPTEVPAAKATDLDQKYATDLLKAGADAPDVGVSFDKNMESWKNGVAKLGIEYTQVSDLKQMRESPVAKAYHIGWIPTIYVIDPQGKVALATVVSDKVSAYLHSVYPDCAE